MGLEMLMNMFGGLGIGSPAVPVRSDELYATQLSQLQEMGFFDTRENIQALIAIAGNVHAAVERLLGNPGQQIVIIVIILFNMTYIINRGPL
ncbi:ubiquitin domain-containing protein DSK2a-like isoform X2 [Camellia sinensis]|uniref:ubiquitin domain-containing protein DSK2a-like isoform X2 n=1 Tax=Camellia sinensis TaxID=4442 RepID=UPI001036A129|nr:ubiquitin domain-containing protein DSK2a-like isoform X2 [Camellia sinensis]